uniref:Uncharacterized protein n=1 Tax=Anguilla anguilla TaxID=7936 RepID=A0A0E9W864_ANGAN
MSGSWASSKRKRAPLSADSVISNMIKSFLN